VKQRLASANGRSLMTWCSGCKSSAWQQLRPSRASQNDGAMAWTATKQKKGGFETIGESTVKRRITGQGKGAAQAAEGEGVGIMKMHVVENVPMHALVQLHGCLRLV
jgi:hypothetical protein